MKERWIHYVLTRSTASLLVGVLLLPTVVADSPEPKGVPPEICDLSVIPDPDSHDVAITWTGGTPPFTVVRAYGTDLRASSRLEVVAAGIGARQWVDDGAFDPDTRLYYQIFDSFSPPSVFRFSPDGGLPGAEITIEGVGFRSDCDDIVIQAGGVDVPVKVDCSFTRIIFEVPEKSMTGHLVVATPAGATVAGLQVEEHCRGTVRRPMSW